MKNFGYKNALLIIILLIFYPLTNWGQSIEEVKNNLQIIGIEVDSSQRLLSNDHAVEIINYGEGVIPILIEFFTDSTQTNTFSECQEKHLEIGEIAIILADRIDHMPYARLTGIQNCTATFCENNPNLIEYYLWAIDRNDIDKFVENYSNWFFIERKEYTQNCRKRRFFKNRR